MVNLRIQTKQQKGLLNLKVVSEKEKFPVLVEKKEGKITLISEEKTYYLYLNKQAEDYNFHKVYNFFVSFAKDNQKSINIDIKSFVSPKLSEELVLQAVIEGILFGIHQTIDYKAKKKEENKKRSLATEKTDYCLITLHKEAKAVLDKSQIKLEAVNFARDLQDTPPNKLHAKEFAEIVKDKFAKSKDIQVDILDKKNYWKK